MSPKPATVFLGEMTDPEVLDQRRKVRVPICDHRQRQAKSLQAMQNFRDFIEQLPSLFISKVRSERRAEFYHVTRNSQGLGQLLVIVSIKGLAVFNMHG